jgi:hypothetical protein
VQDTTFVNIDTICDTAHSFDVLQHRSRFAYPFDMQAMLFLFSFESDDLHLDNKLSHHRA